MELQLIFVVETDSKCKSDWIYIKDIEQVYLGRKIPGSQKKNEASAFKAKKLIDRVDEKRISVKEYRINTSNILCVLDKYLERR